MTPDRDVGFDDRMRVTERGVEIAVALLDDHRLGREPVDLDRIVIGRHHRRQFVDFEDHAVGRIFGGVGIVREHDRDRLADIAHAAARERRLAVRHQLLDAVVAEVDRRDVGEVLAGPDRDHARRGQRVGGVHRLDPPVRQRRTHDAHVKLAGKRHVAGEQAAAAHQRRILDPRHRGADDAARLLFGLLHRPMPPTKDDTNPYDFGGALGNVGAGGRGFTRR